MLNFFKKKSKGTVVTYKIDGMHCTSCSMNIDGELEDTKGVISATTSYAKATTRIEFDENLVSKEELIKVVEKLDYQLKETN